MATRLSSWIGSVFDDGGRVYLKRLSGNDTLLTCSHQAGPYIPKKIIFELFPSLAESKALNPRVSLPVVIVSHSMPERVATAIWYNNKVVDTGTRDECRVTGWGGKESPLLDPESTGSLAALCFKGRHGEDAIGCEVWVCSSPEEEEILENRFGPVEPGGWLYIREPAGALTMPRIPGMSDEVRDPTGSFLGLEPDAEQLSFVLGRPVDRDCRLTADQIPAAWLTTFPSGEAIVHRSASMRPDYSRLEPDKRLLKRRECEYEVFRSVEEIVTLPVIDKGFSNIDAFINFANSVTNRRKARSGRSLELHAKRIFDEEQVSSYSHDEISEGRKRPDFLFPSAEAYQDACFPVNRLRMLATKTTCKDRWRQVADEAARIEKKHLLTLQEGVSESQFAQMERAGVVLVVPKPLHGKFPKVLREKLVTFEQFINDIKRLG